MEIISVKSALKNSGTGRVGSTAIPKFSGRVRVGYFASLLRVGSISGRVITRHIPSLELHFRTSFLVNLKKISVVDKIGFEPFMYYTLQTYDLTYLLNHKVAH